MKYGNLLTLEEVEKIINIIPNLPMFKNPKSTKLDSKGYQTLFKLLYHGMMRASEIIDIKKEDVDHKNQIIRSVKTKGNKTTSIIFTSQSLWQDILEHMQFLKPTDLLFPISRQRVWGLVSMAGQHTKIKVEHPTKSTENPYANLLRDSREHHLKLTRIFRESELDKLCRKSPKDVKYQSDVSLDKLKKLEGEANEFLKTFCDECEFPNPTVANFCCRCGQSIKIGKSIL